MPSEKEENPTVFRMKLWAEDPVRAKSKFWCVPFAPAAYFLNGKWGLDFNNSVSLLLLDGVLYFLCISSHLGVSGRVSNNDMQPILTMRLESGKGGTKSEEMETGAREGGRMCCSTQPPVDDTDPLHQELLNTFIILEGARVI